MTTNQLRWAELQESRRHNVISEGEAVRHDVETESVGRRQAAASLLGSQAAAGQVGLGYANLAWSKEQYEDTGRRVKEAEGSKAYAEAGYKQALSSKVPFERANITADTTLKQQQTKTQKTQSFVNTMTGIDKGVSATGNAYDLGAKIFSDISTSGYTALTRNTKGKK